MQQTMRTIKLYGKLRKFGREFKLAVSTPAEAIKALCVMVPGFEKFLLNSKNDASSETDFPTAAEGLF